MSRNPQWPAINAETADSLAQFNTVVPAEPIAIARRAIRAGLDHVAAEAGPEGYLAGDRFTVADLAAAALLAPACNPPHPDMEFPQPRPARLDAWLNEWADHPGTAWVRSIYAKHRPQRVLPLRAPAD